VTQTSLASWTFAISAVPAVEDTFEVHVLVLRDGHPGAAAAHGTGEGDLLAAFGQADAAAASAAAASGFPGPHPGLPAPQPVRAHAGHNPATARHEPGAAEAAITGVVAAAPRHEVEGTWTTRATETAILHRRPRAVRPRPASPTRRAVARS
jgi:hypothetical protein